jgi:cytochrome b involved in lipid metabolism
LKTVIDFNVEVDIHDNEAWRRALSKWPECSGKTKFTLKELLVYVDLNQLVQSLKKGQSINLRENFLPAPDRVYSVNTVDVENGILNLLVKRQVYRDGSLGAGSYFLTNKESIGQQVSCHILPPLSFTLPKDNNKPILLFANGNGVAPFTHFLSELNKNKCTNPVCLVYLTRSEQEDWLEMQLRQHSQLLSNFQCCVIYTGKNKRVEWLTNSKIDSVNSSHDKLFAIDEVINRFKPEEFMACICGSVPFTKTLLDTLKKELGENRFLRMVGNSQLVYEAFSFTESDEVRKASLNREFTLDEINKHNTQESCWVTVDGTVYDITDFLNIHKAGRDMFLSKALVDRDMTAMYRLTHNGSSTAESWLQSYRIGRIKVTTADYPSVTVEPQTKPCPLSIQDTVLQMHPISADTATCPFLSRPRKTDSLQKEKLAANTSESTPKDLLIKSSEKLESTPDISASKSWCGFFKRAISLIGIRVSADADPIYEKQYI